jgi:putative membrane protein
MPEEPQNDPRVYFAAERTFLAWLRTGLALMGIGFTIARFSLFLQEERVAGSATTHQSLPVYSGETMVVMGVAMMIFSILRFLYLTRQLREGRWKPGVPPVAVALTVVLAIFGCIIAASLFTSH